MRQNQRTPHIAVSLPDQRYCISALFRSEGYERLVRLATGDSVGIWRVWVFGADDRRGNRLIRLRSPKDTRKNPRDQRNDEHPGEGPEEKFDPRVHCRTYFESSERNLYAHIPKSKIDHSIKF